MKSYLYSFAAAAVLITCMASCSKDDTTTTPAANNNNNNTPVNTQGPQPPTPAPAGNNLSGALISLKMAYTVQYAGMPQATSLESEIGLAIFYDNPGSATKADAGTVSVNSNNLDKNQDKSYFKWAYAGGTPSSLGLNTTSDWNVGGSSAVAAFSYNDDSAFPEFSGSMPSSITKANGVSFTFNSSTLTGADSVYVVIASGSQSITRSYVMTAGAVTISSADLQNFATVSDNTATLEVCPFRYHEVTKNGRNYVFIKEQAIVRGININ